jgi:hypothetical protein
MPAGADVLATDELEGCEIGDLQVATRRIRSALLLVITSV